MEKMNLFRFRPLANELDLCRATNILKTGEFWCSYFWELNDPMEGVYITKSGKNFIDEIYKAKKKMICSFSDNVGLNEPTLWGYYANGFRGLAIEIEMNEINKPKKIIYETTLPIIDSSENVEENAIKILTKKLNAWKHENEYRYIIESEENFHNLGKITAVYFGDPYHDSLNFNDISKKDIIKEYIERKNKLINVAYKLGLKTYKVYIERNTIKIIESQEMIENDVC
jgi:hypothetical protein